MCWKWLNGETDGLYSESTKTNDIMKGFTYKISVEAITGRISIGKYKWLLITIPLKHIRPIRNLVEQGQEVFRMSVGASSTIEIAIFRVRHMALMIFRVQVLAVPARREDNFRANAHGTGFVWETGIFAVGADATVTDGLAGKVVGLGAFQSVTGEHAEILWEGD
jgi:hypothetical protein